MVTLQNMHDSIPARQQFIQQLREHLINIIGDHKWMVRTITETKNPELFNTDEDEYENKFLCKTTCECEGEGDCDPDDCTCTFQTPKTAVIIQYNTKYGDLDEHVIRHAVRTFTTASEYTGQFDEIIITHQGATSAPGQELAAKLTALTGKNKTETALIQQTLTTLLENLPQQDQATGNLIRAVKKQLINRT